MEAKIKTTEVILALRPGRREMGVAVLEADELVDWRVSCFREPVGDALLDAVERRVVGLVQRFEPTVIAIEKPSEVRLRMSPALSGVVARIRSVAQDAGLRFVAIRPEAVRKRVCGEEKATRREMAEKLVERFPGLERYVEGANSLSHALYQSASLVGKRRVSEGKWQEEYWGPMFSAVGVGVAVLR